MADIESMTSQIRHSLGILHDLMDSAPSWPPAGWQGSFHAALPYAPLAQHVSLGPGIAGIVTAPDVSAQSFAPPSTIQTGLNIVVTYDSSVSSAPAGFTTAVDAAVAYLESQFSDPITITINVGYGEVGGSALSSGALGQSSSSLFGFTYAELKDALTADGTTADDATAIASLAASDPTGTDNFFVTIAEARALGLYQASGGFDDGSVGFSDTANFDYDNANGVAAGAYDFYDVVLHELTEIMGRQLAVGDSIGGSAAYEPLDLFHYSAAGTRLFTGTSAGYFSINGGTTNLNNFNTDPGGDFGDWAASAGHDSFLAFSSSSHTNPVSEADLKEMDILGFDRVTGGGAMPDLTANTLSLNLSTFGFHINNVGSATAGASTAGIYLSTDSTITTSDTRINTYATPSLAASASDTESVGLTLPTGLTPGTYYLGVIADYNATVSESNEANNASTALAIILGNDSANTLNGTAGADHVFALGGGDTIAMGANLTSADQIDGGTGTDTLTLSGNYSGGLIFAATTMINVESITLGAGFDYNLTTDNATVAAAQSLTVNGAALGSGDMLTFNGAAETNGTFNVTAGAAADTLTGGAGNDTLNGGDGNDTLHLENGGNDTATGGNGNDKFYLGGALTASDSIDAGAGTDTVFLDGDYSGGVTLGAATLLNVETLTIAAGHSYSLTTNDATVASGQLLTVDASALGSGNTFLFNGGAENNGRFTITGGAGNDTLTGGSGADIFHVESGGNDTVSAGGGNDKVYLGAGFTASDGINGGSGTDYVYLNGNYSGGVVFGATTMLNVEHLIVTAGQSYNLTTADATVAANQLFYVDGSDLGAGDALAFNGAADTNGRFVITGGAGNDTLSSGAGNDLLHLEHGGNDAASAGAGNDKIYLAGTLTAADSVDGGAGTDYVYLDGNYSGGVVFGASTLTNVENLTLTAGNNYNLTLNDGTVASGQTLYVNAALAAANSLTFNAAAEVNGRFVITSGAGNDTLTAGGGADIFHLESGGNDTVAGGGNNDKFYLAGTFTAADSIDGGAGTDYVYLNGDYSGGVVFGAATMVNVDHLVLSAGHNYTLTSDNATVASGQLLYVDGSALTAGNALNFNGGAETNGRFSLTGGAGMDTLTGGTGNDIVTSAGGNDTLHLENGGNDTVTAGDGNDKIYFGGALTASDSVDGGTGTDTVYLDGAYAGFTLTPLLNIENLTVAAGHDYNLTSTDALVASGLLFTVDASALGAGNALTFNGAAEINGRFTFTGGAGNDTLTGSTGNDNFHLENGGNDSGTGGNGNDQYYFGATLSASDHADGGAGTDYVHLDGDYSGGVTFGATTMLNVEHLDVAAGHNYNLTANNAMVASGQLLYVDGSALSGANSLTFNGTAETDGRFNITGGAGNDVLSAGSGADILAGGTGNDTLTGGAGNDKFTFTTGDGDDTIMDFIAGNAGGDTASLAGYGIANFAALQTHMAQVGSDTVITFDASNHITLHNVTMTDLNSGDFMFS